MHNLMQVAVLFVPYRGDRTHAGPGWWTLGAAALSLGFACNYLRDAPAVARIAIVGNNLAEFSHGICPECLASLYPDYSTKNEVKS